MKENEPENFAKISKIMLPKDYIVYRLSGEFSTDFSDASGMLLLDVEHKCWSKTMMENIISWDVCLVQHHAINGGWNKF